MNSIQKLIGSSVKLGLVQAGIPFVMAKVQETKIETERKAKAIAVKAVIGVFALIFFLVFTAFLFTGIFFFLSGRPGDGLAAVLTSLIAFLISVIIGGVSLSIK